MSRDEETKMLGEVEQAKEQLRKSLRNSGALIAECKARLDGDMRCHGELLDSGRTPVMPTEFIRYIGYQLRVGRLCTTGPGTAMSIRPIT